MNGFEEGKAELYNLVIKYPADRENPALFANVLESGQVVAIYDIQSFVSNLKPGNRRLLEELRVNSLIVSPIQDKNSKYGLLIVGSIGTEKALTPEDQQMIESISRLLSLSFQSATNLERETGLRNLFQKYVPAVVLDGIRDSSGHSAAMVPKSVTITSLFVDLRDFTKKCENLAPERVLDMIRLYSEFVTARIAEAGGIIDKLVGDGINAFFPEENEGHTGHAKSALQASLSILSDIDQLNAEFQIRGYGNAAIGIGVSTGRAIVGNAGCDRKLDYTAMGDTVNTASRFSGLNEKLSTHESFCGLWSTPD